ncbi:MAG: bifunctional 5,10-methylenetetrahydrofolate dehydrogenase/5,10-methenyltetrahydrofolate cyclohydrolase [Patescibacteria group bacterium]
MKKIDGRALSAKIREDIKELIKNTNISPKLAVLLVGGDPASHLYVSLKEKAAAEVGIQTTEKKLPASVTTEELISIIEPWNNDPEINGILVQLPLPQGIDEDAVIAAMDPKKDADGFHPENIKALLEGRGHIIPPVHEGILRLIGATDTVINGAHAVIIANSEIFSKPLNYLLQKAGATVKVFMPQEIDRETLAHADIIVIAIGQADFLKRGMISPGACVIDVGTNKIPENRIVGDVDEKTLEEVTGWLSPVPGGVGPMTIAALLKNVVNLALKF